MRQALVQILLAVLLALLLACNTASEQDHMPSGAPATLDQPSLASPPVSVQYLLENPAAYVGKRLTFGGAIVDVWSPRAFTVIGHQFLANDAMLVVTRDELEALKANAAAIGVHGASVRVRGTLRIAGIDAVEQELGVDLSEVVHSLARVQGPVFVADRVLFTQDR